jgi:hypothetical protein
MYKFALATILGLSVIGAALPSQAMDIGLSGIGCQPQFSSTAVVRNQFGITNSSTAQAWMLCPAPTTSANFGNTNVTNISANLMDRSDTDDIICNAFIMNANGTIAATASFNTIGVNSPTSVSKSASIPANAATRGVHFECRLPAPTGFGNSHVNTYSIRTNHLP